MSRLPPQSGLLALFCAIYFAISAWSIGVDLPQPLLPPPILAPLPEPPAIPEPLVWVLYDATPGDDVLYLDATNTVFPLGPVEFDAPAGGSRLMTRDRQGGVFVVSTTGLHRFTVEGQAFHLPLSNLRAVDVTNSGVAFVVSDDTLYAVGSDGSLLDSTPGGGNDVVVDDASATVWVVGDDVRRYGVDLVEHWSVDPVSWGAFSIDVAVEGAAWIVERRSTTPPVTGTNRLLRVDSDGIEQESTPLGDATPWSVRIHFDGSVWVTAGGCINRYDSAGTLITRRCFDLDTARTPLSLDLQLFDVWVGFSEDVRRYDLDLAEVLVRGGFPPTTSWALSVGEDDHVFTTLLLDTEVPLLLSPSNPNWGFRMESQPGEILQVDVFDDQPENYNGIYLGWDLVPFFPNAIFHAAADGPFSASQRLIIPQPRDEPAFLTVRGFLFPSGSNHVRILARHKKVALESFSADQGGVPQEVLHGRVRGAGFDSDVTFLLEPLPRGAAITASEVLIVSGEEAHLTFDLSHASIGTFDLVALKEGDEGRVEGAYTMMSSSIGQDLEARLVGRHEHRFERGGVLTLRYSNRGDTELPAPLFRIRPPAGVSLRLLSEETFVEGDLLVLGVDADGVAGVLPAGVERELSILFTTSRVLNCGVGDNGFLLDRLVPTDEEIVWADIGRPVGMTTATWSRLRDALAREILTWRDFLRELAQGATRLAASGRDGSSARRVFDLLARKIEEEPNAAISGRLRSAGGRVLIGQTVHAYRAGETVTCATSDTTGRFVLENLESGRTYDLRSPPNSEATSVAIPTGGDRTGVPLLGDVMIAPAQCDQPLQLVLRHFPSPPEVLFERLARWCIESLRSWDPNEKRVSELGTQERRDEDRVRSGADLVYSVFFENEADASAVAQTVRVKDLIDCDRFDCETLKFVGLKLGQDRYTFVDGAMAPTTGAFVCAGLGTPDEGVTPSLSPFLGTGILRFSTDVPFDAPLCMTLAYGVTPGPGGDEVTIDWTLAGEASDSPDAGILPPNDASGRGEGRIDFLVQAREDLDEGTPIVNEAEIRFDANGPITTPEVRLVVGDFSPEKPGDPRPNVGTDVNTGPLSLSWHSDGARTYQLWVWPDGDNRPRTPTATGDVEQGRGVFHWTEGPGAGMSYQWLVWVDNESGSTRGDPWSFNTRDEVLFRRCDVNDDWETNISDASATLNFLFLHLGTPPTCLKALDCDDTGELGLTDAVFLLNFLFNGGPTPPAPYDTCATDPTQDRLSCTGTSCVP